MAPFVKALFFLLLLVVAFARDDTYTGNAKKGKDKKEKNAPPPEEEEYPPPPGYEYPPPPAEECPPPPSPPDCSPPPPPPPSPPPPRPPPPPRCPPPPPRCPTGCIPAPRPPCGSCGCGSSSCGGNSPSPCRTCGRSPGMSSPPPMIPVGQPGAPRQPDDPTESDVQNLNSLLSVQFVLSQIYLKASLGQIGPADRKTKDGVSEKAVLAQNQTVDIIPQMLQEFSAISIAQVSSMVDLLKGRAVRATNVQVTNEALNKGVNKAFDNNLPQFDVANSPTNLLLAIQTLGPTLAASLATNIVSQLQTLRAVSLVSGILGALAGQDASIRTVLFMDGNANVTPNVTVSQFMQKTSMITRNLASGVGSTVAGGNNILSVSVFGTTIGLNASNVMNLLSSLLNVVQVGSVGGGT